MTEFLLIIAFLVGIVLHDWTRISWKRLGVFTYLFVGEAHYFFLYTSVMWLVPFRAEGATDGRTVGA